jgi:small subunit ribosomal protein S8
MSITDPLSDLLTRVRNGQAANKPYVTMPSSKLKVALCSVLKREGYIEDFSETGNMAKANLQVYLKYYKNLPVINNIQRISSPGRRIYKSSSQLPSVLGGFGIAIVSTSRGLLTDKEARQSGLGGEILCAVS